MRARLIETLTKYATLVEEAQTTNSVYFTMLNGIRVRVSDHHTTHPDCDLAIDVPENAVAYTIFPVKALAKFTYQTIEVESIYNYISYFAMIAPCFKSAQGSKKEKQVTEEVEETPINTEVSEKVMKKVNALPEGEKKEMILNFIKDFHLSDMSSKVGYILKCKSVSKGQELINKWTKQ
jgi:hypothetical protein